MAAGDRAIYRSLKLDHPDEKVGFSKWPQLSCSAANELMLATPPTEDDPNPGDARLAIDGTLKLKTGLAVNEFSIDGTLGGNSDLAVPTEKAVKAYADSKIEQVNLSLSTKAALNGDPSKNFQAQNLTVNGSLTTTGNASIGTLDSGTKLEVKGHLILDAGENPNLFTGTGDKELNRYLLLLNSPGTRSASGLKVGGLLVSDSYDYANPGKNDLTVKGNVGIGNSLSFGFQARQMVNLWGEVYGIGVQSWTQYFRSDADFGWYRKGTHNDARQNPGGGARLMALNESGDLILSARTNPNNEPEKPMCRALVDLDRKLVINFANDFSNGVEMGGQLRVNGDLEIPNTGGGFATFTNYKYGNEADLQPNNVKLVMGYRGGFIGRPQPPLTYEFALGEVFGSFITRTTFTKRFSVNQAGDVYVGNRINVQDITIRSGNKPGYVSDYFVNRVGDTLEQGDVVIISRSVSHFYATENDIPIPEVDLTEQAYDSRVCGIVAKVVTEEGLPYVEIAQASQSESGTGEPVPQENVQPVEHPLKELAAKSGEETDIKKVSDQQMGSMVTLGSFSYCKVDADIAPIEVGDLLTTSTTKGHAQKVLERERATGAIIGKALASLEKGKGKIPVLVMLQ